MHHPFFDNLLFDAPEYFAGGYIETVVIFPKNFHKIQYQSIYKFSPQSHI